MAKENPNPFSPGGIVKSTLFGGRHAYILNLLKRLSAVQSGKPASFYLYGERGIGKTALAKLISYIATKQDEKFHTLNFITSYYTTQPSQSFKAVLEASLNNVADKIEESVLKKIGTRLGKIFKDGKFNIGAFGFQAGYETGERLNGTIIIKDQVVTILRNIINQIKESTPEAQKKDGILIIIDEMDNLSDIPEAAAIIRGITTELDFEDNGYISFLLIGYENGYEAFVKGDESIRRLVDSIQLKEMPDNEVIETFEKGFNAANVAWNKQILKEKAWMTGGYPLAIQILGYHLIESDVDGQINQDDWDKSVTKSANELIDKEYSSYYSFDIKQKKNTDRILQALAIGSLKSCETLSGKEIEQICEVKNPSQYLKLLLKTGVVIRSKVNKEYIIKRGMLRTSILLDMMKDFEDEIVLENFFRMSKEAYKIKKMKSN